jgi:hypothetical protein
MCQCNKKVPITHYRSIPQQNPKPRLQSKSQPLPRSVKSKPTVNRYVNVYPMKKTTQKSKRSTKIRRTGNKPHYKNQNVGVRMRGVSPKDFARERQQKKYNTVNKKMSYQSSEYDKIPKHKLKSWNTIHIKARNANTPEKKQEFIRYINYLATHFPCPQCVNHIKEYLVQHPIESYLNVKDGNGKDIGLFKWSWEFHNAVNRRLGKAEMTWDKLLKIYI